MIMKGISIKILDEIIDSITIIEEELKLKKMDESKIKRHLNFIKTAAFIALERTDES